MRLENLRLNGISEPLGYLMENLRLSFRVAEGGSFAEHTAVSVRDDRQEVFAVSGRLDNACIPLEFTPAARTRYTVHVTVTDDEGRTASASTWLETGLADWEGRWIAPREEDAFHPEFRKEFSLSGAVASARLYISGLGLYTARLNGQPISREVLTPYYSRYDREIQYQTYDVTALLGGSNTLDIRLGNGWYKGKFGLASQPNNFGSRFALLAQLEITYADGTGETIATDESWRYRGSLVEESGIYDGEIRNHLLWEGKENPWKAPEIITLPGIVKPRWSLPVVEKEYIAVKEVLHTPKGETVLDFGQNFAGYPAFHVKGKKGQKIVLDFGEIMQEDCFYRDNYRSAKSQFTYVSDGREEWVRPEFTWFGFRYVRVTGWEGEVDPADFRGCVLYSDMPTTMEMETGHGLVNQLLSNALWGQKSNFIDFPTDCPQRDERLGWTGDCQVFSGAASYNMDTSAFFHKFLHDLRTEQERFDGILPGVIPVFGGPIFSSVWGDIATILPTVLYRHSGDREALRLHYPIMRDWVDKITREDIKRGQRYLYDFGNQLGDWLALNGKTDQSMEGGTDEHYIGSHYYANSVKMTAEAAQALGYEEDARKYRELHEKIRQAILREYFTSSGRLCFDTQTAYIVALSTGIYPDKQVLVRDLKKRFYRDCYKLTGGFTGSPILCRVLAENGLVEEAYHFLLNEEYPGWLNCVKLGATTIWERWNSVLQDGRISGTHMNSLNHFAYGAVVEFLYRDAAGLIPTEPGFRSVRIAPMLSARLGHVKLRYESVHGLYRSEWEIEEDGNVSVTVEIPFGCTARLELPDYAGNEIGELTAGVYRFRYTPTRDVRAKYTGFTPFRELLADPKALEAIKSSCPMLMYFLGSGNEDFLSENCQNLKNKGFMGFREDQVEKLEKALAEIR